jgi:hypothetical protein
MKLEPGCPRCPDAVIGTDRGWSCSTHGPIDPLWSAVEPDYYSFADHLVRADPLPTWLPWPLPPGWQVTDFGSVQGAEAAETGGGSARAVFVTCTGPSDLDGVVEATVVTEEPGVGLGARCAAVTHTDPGHEVGDGPPSARIRVEAASVPVWPVSTVDRGGTLDRAVLAGEAEGRWLWLVLRPASAALLLPGMGALNDVSRLGPSLMTLPFGSVPRSW